MLWNIWPMIVVRKNKRNSTRKRESTDIWENLKAKGTLCTEIQNNLFITTKNPDYQGKVKDYCSQNKIRVHSVQRFEITCVLQRKTLIIRQSYRNKQKLHKKKLFWNNMFTTTKNPDYQGKLNLRLLLAKRISHSTPFEENKQ